MASCIDFHDVWKEYRIGGSHYRSLRDDLVGVARSIRGAASRLAGRPANPVTDTRRFSALRGVSVSIQQGERIAFIGSNGAGKTTALRLMGRITSATRGSVAVRGRVGALIAVGAGIHPELSGRENIFLYGSIMGMKKSEIRERFDRIVAFSGVEQFLDTPVKYYSSGMRVRLGFSVAVHVNPDIMLVDEVLAVGDFDFQRKCLLRIDELAAAGCTIVFVSHDLNAVMRLCPRAVFLNHGEIAYDGDSQRAVTAYLDSVRSGAAGKGGATPTGRGVRYGSFEATIEEASWLERSGRESGVIESGDSLTLLIRYHAHQPIANPDFGFDIRRGDGELVFGSQARWRGLELSEISGEGTVRLVFDRVDLIPGTYSVGLSIRDQNGISFYDAHDGAYSFRVDGGTREVGVYRMPHHWEADRLV